MKRLSLALAASLIGVAPTAGAVDYTFNIATAISSNGETGAPGNAVRTLNIPAGSIVTGFGWDVRLEAYGGSEDDLPSSFYEMQVVFGANNFILEPAFWDPWDRGGESTVLGEPVTFKSVVNFDLYEPPVNGTFTIFNIEDLAGKPFTVGANGLRMEFSESVNDEGFTPDGKWIGGTLTIRTTPASPVPEPGTYGLMALGMLGIAAAVWRRRV